MREKIIEIFHKILFLISLHVQTIQIITEGKIPKKACKGNVLFSAFKATLLFEFEIFSLYVECHQI